MDQAVVGIRFVEAGPVAYCSPGDLNLGAGDYVVVRTDMGERLGWVVVAADQVISATVEGPVRVVDRLASAEDVEAYREQKRRAEEDVSRAQAVATRLDPRMRVASLTYNLQGDRAHLTYTARDENGSDRLRRELSREFDIELRVEQVGDRDREKALGGIGQCGRALCCATWMTEFPAISIKMAKDQGLAPNPSKISGVCGRLLCCLSFEVDAYREIIGTLPKVGKRITTPVGRAKVLSINAMTEMVRLRFDEGGQIVEIPADQLRSQYGTAVRPEDLEREVERPIHERDRELQEAFIAAIEPVSSRPGTAPAALPGSRPAWETDETDLRPDGDAAEQPARRSRRGLDGSRDDAPGRTPSSGTRAAGGVRIARRRRAQPDAGDSSPASEQPAARPDDSAPSGESAAEGDRRRRRRGRRGGRRRRSGGEGGSGGGE
jgi:cell fate regulator YaaT (PSP1 superfamily)